MTFKEVFTYNLNQQAKDASGQAQDPISQTKRQSKARIHVFSAFVGIYQPSRKNELQVGIDINYRNENQRQNE